ncbi:uncharacterized protein LOC127727175 [Mytilus californianus]|uniref:uncharacterized protein LOC127727175 n=1 Tax=Mytilus californianus TaxID=6549 RepID=UPI0022483DCF|nr:uncharacterized protein LOC127727175 [Mytilus californianus]
MSQTLVLLSLYFSFTQGSWWRPHQHMYWNDVISEHHINTGVQGEEVFVLDLFDVPKSIIDDLHRKGKKVVCYFSAGTKEDWRADASKFPRDGLGDPNKDWPGETWVDIRNSHVRRIMRDRISYAASRHCDGVDPDNVDGWAQNQAGLHLTPADQLDYNRYLAREAHGHGLAIGLKNDVSQLSDLVGDFDFAINESCMNYHECGRYKPFFDARKPVFHIQYVHSTTEGHQKQHEICSSSDRPHDMNTIIKVKTVNWKLAC